MEPNGGDRRLQKYGRRYVSETFGENEKREKKDIYKTIRESQRTPDPARYLHPLLPDPPPILLKHVTKTSIAVPALPVTCLSK